MLIEVGPGAVLSNLVRETADIPVIALDAGGNSLGGLLQALGAAFALGAPVKHAALFADRFTRPFNLDWKPKFFANPCELAPVSESSERRAPSRLETEIAPRRAEAVPGAPIELIRRLVAARAELPASAVRDESRMLSDLHLNSITVGQLVSEAAKQLGLPRIVGLTDFANASVADIARALEELKRTGGAARRDDQRQPPPGVDNWVRTFTVELVQRQRPAHRSAAVSSRAPAEWQIFAPKNHPLAGPLRAAFGQTNPGGVVVCLPENPGAKNISLLLKCRPRGAGDEGIAAICRGPARLGRRRFRADAASGKSRHRNVCRECAGVASASGRMDRRRSARGERIYGSSFHERRPAA